MPNTLHLFPSQEIINMSVFPESTTRFPSYGMAASQLQELKLQILIYRYMLAGTVVPHHLLLQIKKTIVHSAPFFLHYQPLQLYSDHHQQPPLFCWGRSSMDPEPGRCRRTDGKKWRCSRDVVAEQKYCERHVHRGRNRSRKPVEIPTTMSRLQHNSPESITEKNNNRSTSSESHVLRHFINDWPRHNQESEVMGINANARCLSSATCLSMSMPGVVSSDVSLKLSTGGDELCYDRASKRDLHNHLALTGGPLAEALRSSTSNASPTSVLHQLSRACGSEISFV